MKGARNKSLTWIELFFRGLAEGSGWAIALFVFLVILKLSGIYGFHFEASWLGDIND